MIGFWIFMLVMDLLIPVTMLVFGIYFIKNVPKEINMTFGYRTEMSMKNKDTWIFAHNYCGKLWLVIGCITLILSIIAMFFAIGKEIEYISIFGLIVCGIQLVFLILSIIPTEIALKRHFDKEGNRRN